MAGDDPFGTPVTWRKADDVDHPYEATVEGQPWRIRLNDWPDDPTVYTLLTGHSQHDFDNWPQAWGEQP